MNRILIPGVALVIVVLQTTFIPSIAIGRTAPDLVFLFVIFLSLQRQTTLGIWTAFGAGLLQDIAGGGMLGLNALLLLCLAYLAVYLRQKFFQENFISRILIILLFTFLHQGLTFFWMNTLLHTHYEFSRWLVRALGMSLYHGIMGPLFFKGLSYFFHNDEINRNLIKSHSDRSRFSSMQRPG